MREEGHIETAMVSTAERLPGRGAKFLALLAFVVLQPTMATPSSVSQTDWSGGPAGRVAVSELRNTFARSESVSWLAVPGWLALSSVPRSPSTVTRLTNGSYEGAESVYATDIDGDGNTDIIAAAYFGDVSWWRNDGGSPVVWTRHIIDDDFTGANQIFATDIDGDGHTDVLGAAYLASEVSWWRNDGGDPVRWTRHVIDSVFGGACSVFACDLDGDEDTDVLSTAFDTDTIAWWENDGGASPDWTRHLLSDDFGGAHEVRADDIDGDGDHDVVGAAWDGDNVVWWRNDGGSPILWSPFIIDRDFNGASSIDVADIDGDGDSDIVGAARNVDQVAWWSNNGGEPIQWTKHVIASGQAGAWSANSADVDGDGDLDLLSAAWFRDELTWWRNEGGAPIVWGQYVIDPSLGGASAVFATDVDADGAVELLAAGFDEADIVVWKATQFRQAGWLESTIIDTESGFWGGRCTWSAVEPEGTTLSVEARTLDAPDDDEAWTEIESGTRITTLAGRRYLQLRANLSTSDPDVSPILEAIECQWPKSLIRRPRERFRPESTPGKLLRLP
jgi:hypothetical protein